MTGCAQCASLREPPAAVSVPSLQQRCADLRLAEYVTAYLAAAASALTQRRSRLGPLEARRADERDDRVPFECDYHVTLARMWPARDLLEHHVGYMPTPILASLDFSIPPAGKSSRSYCAKRSASPRPGDTLKVAPALADTE